MLQDISQSDQWVIRCAVDSEEASFDRPTEIQADTICRLLLGLATDSEGRSVRVGGTGLRIRNAVVRGPINLRHGRALDGGDLPRLALESCSIEETIDLCCARISQLSLRNSKVSELNAEYVHIAGLLDIGGITAHPDSGRPGAGKGTQNICHICLRGAHIEDGIEAAEAHLVAPVKRENYVRYSERAHYALDLAEARIDGDMRLFPDFTAHGGVNVNGAIIQGSFQAHGAQFSKEELYALDASGAHIYGSLSLDARNISQNEREQGRNRHKGTVYFEATGQLRLLNLSIEEDLRLTGAKIAGRISAENLYVRGDVRMCAFDDGICPAGEQPDGTALFKGCIIRFESTRKIDLRGAEIGGDVDFRGARLGGAAKDDATDEYVLDLSSSVIGGHLLFSPHGHKVKEVNRQKRVEHLLEWFSADGPICLDGANVKGNLSFVGAELKGELIAKAMNIQGQTLFGVHENPGSGQPIRRLVASKDIFLDQSKFGLQLDMSGAELFGELQAADLEVGGQLMLCAYAPVRKDENLIWFHAHKRLNLSGSIIRRDFNLVGARLNRGLRFRGGRVDSTLIIDVEDGLYVRENGEKDRSSIDLFNAHANLLSDFSNTQEDSLGYDPGFFLRLEGFTYGRFRHYRDKESLGEQEVIRRGDLVSKLNFARTGRMEMPKEIRLSQVEHLNLRFKWLNKQYTKGPTRQNYNSDPYNTLYRYYKKMGAQVLADRVLAKKLRTERIIGNPFQKFIYSFFEVLFGYGLKPIRATGFCITYILLIAMTVWASDHPLTYNPNSGPFLPAQTFVSAILGGSRTAVPQGGRCATADNPVSSAAYALEVVIPTLDLGEKKYCDFSSGSGLFWQIFKILATLVGWIMVSLTVLTWTGLFRRNVEP